MLFQKCFHSQFSWFTCDPYLFFFVIADIIVTRTSYYSKWFGVKWNVWILSYEFIILKNLGQTTLSFKIPILNEMNLMRNVQNVLGMSIITKSWTF